MEKVTYNYLTSVTVTAGNAFDSATYPLVFRGNNFKVTSIFISIVANDTVNNLAVDASGSFTLITGAGLNSFFATLPGFPTTDPMRIVCNTRQSQDINCSFIILSGTTLGIQYTARLFALAVNSTTINGRISLTGYLTN